MTPPPAVRAKVTLEIGDAGLPLPATLRSDALRRQAAIAAAQCMFVVGTVYLKAVLTTLGPGQEFQPVVFALAREAIAAPILLALPAMKGAYWPARRDIPIVLLLGACLFASQLLYMLGIELSGVVVATCIQPAIPVLTALLGVGMGLEGASPRKLAGIALSVVGAVAMVFGGAATGGNDVEGAGEGGGRVGAGVSSEVPETMLRGNACLLGNTAAMAVYYIAAKKGVARYPPIAIAAWAYTGAAVLMACAAAVSSPPAAWLLPGPLLGPLAFWVLVCSVGGYAATAWAMQALPASQVAAFQCLQPLLGTVLAASLLGEAVSAWDAGALGVIAGLFLVCSERGDAEAALLVARVRRLLRQRMRRVVSRAELAAVLPKHAQ